MAEHVSLLLGLLLYASAFGGGCADPEAARGTPVRTAVSILENVKSEVWQEGELAGALGAQRIELVPAKATIDMTKVEVVAKDTAALAFLVSEGQAKGFGLEGEERADSSGDNGPGLENEKGTTGEEDRRDESGGRYPQSDKKGLEDRSRIKGQATEHMEISADHFKGRAKEGVGVFEGSVAFTWGKLKLHCTRLEVVYEGDRTEVRKLTASGGVTVELGERRCQSGRATFDPRGRVLVLDEEPVLYESGDEMKGRRIVVNLEQEQIECEACRVRWSPKADKGSSP